MYDALFLMETSYGTDPTAVLPEPTAVVTGFLGAGKTTFLRRLLPLLAVRGVRPSVVINDYQNARVDADTLREIASEVQAIEGSCVCCESVTDLVRMLLDLPAGGNRVVLIEANGTTDPCALIDHITVNPSLRDRFRPLLQLTVVNARRWQRRFWHNELERLQVRTASHVVLTHQEELPSARQEEVKKSVADMAPRAQAVDPENFASLLASLAAKAMEEVPSGHNHACEGACHEHQDHSHIHDHEEHVRLTHGFVSTQIPLPDTVDRTRLLAWLESLPDEVLRVKGVVGLHDMPGRHFVFQKTDEMKWGPTVFELNQPPTVAPCAVLIGVKLDHEALVRSAQDYFLNS
ncbi:MAG: GTP-binding protein [Terrimicrobiaceae bacterium]